MGEPTTDEARELMRQFAARTAIDSDGGGRRYLWTDAFAVCNFLGLARTSVDGHERDLALRLVDRVHHALGRHRRDDPRTGWISGASEADGEAHPTRGGLRIGKPHPERGPTEPYDELREWERDGQYFHYLTKWMHALDQVARHTGEAVFNRWARELAAAAYAAFTHRDPASGRRRMYWKVSIDGTRVLVGTMGHHDPLDGFITCAHLRTTASRLSRHAEPPDLVEAMRGFGSMVDDIELATDDPLGIGGLLCDAFRVEQLTRQGAPLPGDLLERLLAAAHRGLEYWARRGELEAPAVRRLAFRELGLAIGLAGVESMVGPRVGAPPRRPGCDTLLAALTPFLPLRHALVAFWRASMTQDTSTWGEHRDINEVMLATALAPEGFLILPTDDERAPADRS